MCSLFSSLISKILQHPYNNNRMSWNMPGSSPGSPVSASFNANQRLNSNSLPSSPQTRSETDSFDSFMQTSTSTNTQQNNLHTTSPNSNNKLSQPENQHHYQGPTSPVPNIVFTPSNDNGNSSKTSKTPSLFCRICSLWHGAAASVANEQLRRPHLLRISSWWLRFAAARLAEQRVQRSPIPQF